MKRYKIVIFIAVFLFTICPAFAEYYIVYVSRVDQDLYKDASSGVYIQTQFFHRYCIREKALLSYEPFSFNNKLIFDDGSIAKVVKIFK